MGTCEATGDFSMKLIGVCGVCLGMRLLICVRFSEHDNPGFP